MATTDVSIFLTAPPKQLEQLLYSVFLGEAVPPVIKYGFNRPGSLLSPIITPTLLEQELNVLLVFLLLQGQLTVHLQALTFQGHLQPEHQL